MVGEALKAPVTAADDDVAGMICTFSSSSWIHERYSARLPSKMPCEPLIPTSKVLAFCSTSGRM
ncbi:hypothetical protein D3C72_1362210 [compost metagenome]